MELNFDLVSFVPFESQKCQVTNIIQDKLTRAHCKWIIASHYRLMETTPQFYKIKKYHHQIKIKNGKQINKELKKTFTLTIFNFYLVMLLYFA